MTKLGKILTSVKKVFKKNRLAGAERSDSHSIYPQFAGQIVLVGSFTYAAWAQQIRRSLSYTGDDRFLDGRYLERVVPVPADPDAAAADQPGEHRVRLNLGDWLRSASPRDRRDLDFVLFALIGSMTTEIAMFFNSHRCPTAIWEAAQRMYARPAYETLHELYTIHMDAFLSVNAYCQRFRECIHALEGLDYTPDYASIHTTLVHNIGDRFPAWKQRWLRSFDILNPGDFKARMASLVDARDILRSIEIIHEHFAEGLNFQT